MFLEQDDFNTNVVFNWCQCIKLHFFFYKKHVNIKLKIKKRGAEMLVPCFRSTNLASQFLFWFWYLLGYLYIYICLSVCLSVSILWFSAFLIPWPFNTVPYVVVTPGHTVTFVAASELKFGDCYESQCKYLICRLSDMWSLWQGLFNLQRGHDPKGKNSCHIGAR